MGLNGKTNSNVQQLCHRKADRGAFNDFRQIQNFTDNFLQPDETIDAGGGDFGTPSIVFDPDWPSFTEKPALVVDPGSGELKIKMGPKDKNKFERTEFPLSIFIAEVVSTGPVKVKRTNADNTRKWGEAIQAEDPTSVSPSVGDVVFVTGARDRVNKRAKYAIIGGGGGGATKLNDLTDVTISSPANGEVLEYDGTKWVNGSVNNIPGGGNNREVLQRDAGGNAVWGVTRLT